MLNIQKDRKTLFRKTLFRKIEQSLDNFILCVNALANLKQITCQNAKLNDFYFTGICVYRQFIYLCIKAVASEIKKEYFNHQRNHVQAVYYKQKAVNKGGPLK